MIQNKLYNKFDTKLKLMEANNLHDLVIRNGKILDGSGKKPFFGDIAIDDGKITSVGKIQELWQGGA